MSDIAFAVTDMNVKALSLLNENIGILDEMKRQTKYDVILNDGQAPDKQISMYLDSPYM